MILPIAQTNLQLYKQMIRSGYSEMDLQLSQQAYLLAGKITGCILRGSGKPFACHLVGTASVAVECGMDSRYIAAALLHAVYQERIPFPEAETLSQRRAYINQQFGEEVEKLLYGYQKLESVMLESLSNQQLQECRGLIILRLADEIDDLADNGPELHGKPGDPASVPGSAAARRLRAEQQIPQLLRIASCLNAMPIIEHLQNLQSHPSELEWPETLRTGAYTSFSIADTALGGL